MKKLLSLTALLALITLPALASARPSAVFEAPELGPRAARQIDKPVVVDKRDLRQEIQGLRRDISELRALVDNMPRGRGLRHTRRALRAQIDRMDQHLDQLRGQLRQAAELQQIRRRRAYTGPAPAPRPTFAPASKRDMDQIMTALRGAHFRDDQMRVVRRASEHHYFTARQAVRVAKQLSFSSDQVQALVMMYPRLVDPENEHALYASLPYASDRRALEEQIARL